MKLVYPEYDLSLDIKENKVNVLVVENKAVMAEVVQTLYSQCCGEKGQFVFSEGEKILSLDKCANLITDIFSLNCNEKRILSKLYQEIEETALENLVQEGREVSSALVFYLEKLCEEVPYHIAYQTEILPSMIMKMADVKFETEATSLLERIVEYLGITNKIFNYSVNIFVNLKLFLTNEEIQSLYEYAFYNKISLVLIEGVDGVRMPEEQVTIIDVDKCTIKI